MTETALGAAVRYIQTVTGGRLTGVAYRSGLSCSGRHES